MAVTKDSTAVGSHPLDPLSEAEIAAATRLVREEHDVDERHRFVTVTLQEPSKEELKNGDHLDRQAMVVVLDPRKGLTYEGVVSLARETVVSWTHVPDVKPPLLGDEYWDFVDALKADGRFRAALAERGITDLDLVSIDSIPPGYWGAEEERERRLCKGLSFLRPRPGGNGYSRHIEGLVGVVDLNTMEVVRVEDHGAVPVSEDPGEYFANTIELRTDLKTLEIEQPDGPSFELDGNEVSWQRWRFRIGFNAREGLVLHLVRYEDGGRLRPVLYRASYSELAVPYGHPSPGHFFQNVFDFGEAQVGTLANSLEFGCDCLGTIRYLDAVVSNGQGEPVRLPNVICLHEEDFGLLWKHTDTKLGGTEVRRSRRLAVSWIMTVGNYDYGFYWYLYQDGTIESEVKLTGILQTQVLEEGEEPISGELVAPRVNGMIHQHIFNARLDLDVDGTANSVYEVNGVPLPHGEENPWGTAFTSKKTLLRRESEAQREVDPLSGRYWKVVNDDSRNAVGEPVGYKLVPGANVGSLVQPDSMFSRRAGFARTHLWVTPYERRELFATGDYPYQHEGGAGLPSWTEADRPLENTDVVLWYTFGHHHVPRPEDWPVMPVARIGFSLQPVGFFDRNPALDVAPPEPKHGNACN